jgi:hypothetical protein
MCGRASVRERATRPRHSTFRARRVPPGRSTAWTRQSARRACGAVVSATTRWTISGSPTSPGRSRWTAGGSAIKAASTPPRTTTTCCRPRAPMASKTASSAEAPIGAFWLAPRARPHLGHRAIEPLGCFARWGARLIRLNATCRTTPQCPAIAGSPWVERRRKNRPTIITVITTPMSQKSSTTACMVTWRWTSP